ISRRSFKSLPNPSSSRFTRRRRAAQGDGAYRYVVDGALVPPLPGAGEGLVPLVTSLTVTATQMCGLWCDRVKGTPLGIAPRQHCWLSEPEEGYVVQVMVAGAGHLGCVDLDDDHFGEELDLGGQQVAGVGGGRVFFEAD